MSTQENKGFNLLKRLFNSTTKENLKTTKVVKKDNKKNDEKLFPWLMESSGDLTLEETIDIENLLEDDD